MRIWDYDIMHLQKLSLGSSNVRYILSFAHFKFLCFIIIIFFSHLEYIMRIYHRFIPISSQITVRDFNFSHMQLMIPSKSHFNINQWVIQLSQLFCHYQQTYQNYYYYCWLILFQRFDKMISPSTATFNDQMFF